MGLSIINQRENKRSGRSAYILNVETRAKVWKKIVT